MNSFLFVMVAVFLSLVSCKGEDNAGTAMQNDKESALQYADCLQLTEHPEGWWEANVVNPWDSTTFLERLAIVPKTLDISMLELPEAMTVVRTPLEKSLVASTVHIGLIEEFGGENAIAGVMDEDYIKSDKILERLKNGEIISCGSWMSPDIEKVIKLSPDAILLSPYQNGGTYGNITELGIPIIYVADYMEKIPLGRAEWLKFYGLLYGKEKESEEIFKNVETRYNSLKELCHENAVKNGKKKILMDIPYSGIWQVPADGSTNDIFIKEAGATNPFSNVIGDQFAKLNPEKVLYDAGDADVWIIRQNSPGGLSLNQLKKDCTFATQFKAFKDGNVWACNTNESLYFEETPFHPERIMEDLYHILHDSDSPDTLNYFRRLK